MTDASDFAKFAADKRHEFTVADAEWLEEMARDGDLVHIDGPEMTAARELAAKVNALRMLDSDGSEAIVGQGEYREMRNALAAFNAALDLGDPALDEPEPLDAETVAARQEYTRQSIRDAGRGELLP